MRKSTFRRLLVLVFLGLIYNSDVFGNTKIDTAIFQNLEAEVEKTQDAIPFNDVEFPPFFAKCRRITEDCEKRNCVDSFVLNALRNGLTQVFDGDMSYFSKAKKSEISFEIGKDGVVDTVKVKGEDELLKRHIKDVILGFPRLNPGMDNGNLVRVLYELKVVIENRKIEGEIEKYSFEVNLDFETKDSKGKPIKIVENFPVFPGCNENSKPAKQKKCLSEKVKKFINKNFNVKVVEEVGMSGFNRIFVRFKISKCGNVIDVQARGPHPDLEKEAVRVVKALPKTKPAERNGETVGVLYSLPINFVARK
ncbi:energy transducer TonB [Aquimarina sediminis]|uniref:energy transducer TonB n=1 Tax=Aquimarina sediminis TaxID=2070536 RepID=UPI000CA06C42|nr:energy transducer TonB [Aquimarina sediminis]